MSAERGVVEQIMKTTLYGLKFRNKLGNLSAGLYPETTGDGLWEIRAYPKSYAHFPPEDIKRYMEEHGLQGHRAANKAAQRTKWTKKLLILIHGKKIFYTPVNHWGLMHISLFPQIKA